MIEASPASRELVERINAIGRLPTAEDRRKARRALKAEIIGGLLALAVPQPAMAQSLPALKKEA